VVAGCGRAGGAGVANHHRHRTPRHHRAQVHREHRAALLIQRRGPAQGHGHRANRVVVGDGDRRGRAQRDLHVGHQRRGIGGQCNRESFIRLA